MKFAYSERPMSNKEKYYQTISVGADWVPIPGKLGSKDEKIYWSLLSKIVESVTSHPDHGDMNEINAWLSKVMESNVPNGEPLRGLATVSAYKNIMDGRAISEEKLEKACILGWCAEIFYASVVMSASLVGDVQEWRGNPAWHVKENLGPLAFNDAVLLIGAMYYVLKEFFQDEDCYANLLNLFHETQLFLAFGFGLQRHTDVKMELNYLNPSRHEAIVKYQVSYESYYLPLALAMSLAGIHENSIVLDAKNICFKLGYLHQVVQDRKNCAADIGKGALSWFLFQAICKANPNQKRRIRESIGPNMDENEVNEMLELYEEMNLEDLSCLAVTELRNEVTQDIRALVCSKQTVVAKQLTDMLNLII